jgi:hypothetical protein
MQWLSVTALVLAVLALIIALYVFFFPTKSTFLDLQEFQELDSELKGLYKEKVVKHIFPVLMQRVNREWNNLPTFEKDKIRNADAAKVAREMEDQMKYMSYRRIRQTARPLARVVTKAVTKPPATKA